VIKELINYPWPGNIRELENIIQRLLIESRYDLVGPADFELLGFEYTGRENKNIISLESQTIIREGETLEEYLERMEKEILYEYKNRYQSTRKIAKALNSSQTTIVRKLKKYELG